MTRSKKPAKPGKKGAHSGRDLLLGKNITEKGVKLDGAHAGRLLKVASRKLAKGRVRDVTSLSDVPLPEAALFQQPDHVLPVVHPDQCMGFHNADQLHPVMEFRSNPDMGVGDRIKEARLKLHPELSVPVLARRVGLATSTLYELERGEMQTTTKLHRIADFLGVTAEWLESGKGPMIAEAPPRYGSTLEEGPDIRGKVPLISWVQAGAWSDTIDNFQPGDAEDWLACPQAHGPRTYCLRVKGESMYNPGGKWSYAAGEIIFVDPDWPPKHADRIIVRLEDKGETTFKQLIEEGSRSYLKALNPHWPEPIIEITGRATICGVVIGKWVSEV